MESLCFARCPDHQRVQIINKKPAKEPLLCGAAKQCSGLYAQDAMHIALSKATVNAALMGVKEFIEGTSEARANKPDLNNEVTVVVAALTARGDSIVLEDATTLTNLVRAYTSEHPSFKLVTPEDMKAIDVELSRQLAGGCKEASCVSDIGGLGCSVHHYRQLQYAW